MTSATLKPGVARRLKQLQKLARRDEQFMALVDLYRNVDFASETAAYWFAWNDWNQHGGPQKAFQVLAVGYDERELSFLRGRGLLGP